jgi:hypothetical protein
MNIPGSTVSEDDCMYMAPQFLRMNVHGSQFLRMNILGSTLSEYE